MVKKMENEKRLVDLYEFLKECDRLLKNPPFVHPATPWDRGLMIAVETALSLPTVDAVPVVHGRWTPKMYDNSYILCHCSECGSPNARERNYCPNCGAKMDGDGNAER